jgi:hypothetical protein
LFPGGGLAGKLPSAVDELDPGDCHPPARLVARGLPRVAQRAEIAVYRGVGARSVVTSEVSAGSCAEQRDEDQPREIESSGRDLDFLPVGDRPVERRQALTEIADPRACCAQPRRRAALRLEPGQRLPLAIQGARYALELDDYGFIWSAATNRRGSRVGCPEPGGREP